MSGALEEYSTLDGTALAALVAAGEVSASELVDEAGLPIGVQLVGRYGDETSLLQVAAQMERARPWADRIPRVHG
jgi:Asp-tRNA(Asn)/Glu-tRNA(Gln) amidotransferase A subunit family amidase